MPERVIILTRLEQAHALISSYAVSSPSSSGASQVCVDQSFGRSCNERFLRHRFIPTPTNVATPISLPKRIHVAKEAVSAAWQTKTRHRSGQWRKTKRCSNDEAAALRKNHVRRRKRCVNAWRMRPKHGRLRHCSGQRTRNRRPLRQTPSRIR